LKFDSSTSTKRDTLKMLNKELVNKITNRETEIKKVEEMYDLKAQHLKMNQAKRENEIRNNSQRHILSANEEKHRKLQSYKDQLSHDKQRLESERSMVKDRNSTKMTNMINEYDQAYREKYDEADIKAKNVHSDTQQVLNQINVDTRSEIQESNSLSKKHSNTIVHRNENLLEKQREDYLTTLHSNQLKNATNLAKEKMKYEREMRRLNIEQSGESSVKEGRHAKELEDKKKFYNRMIQLKEKGFKSKLTKLIQAQNGVLNNIRDRFHSEVNKVELAMAKKKLSVNTKGKDQFYQVRTLDPKIMDHGKFYSLQIPLPIHEQEGATFNASKRELRINFVRNYSAQVEDETGNINKSKRNELFTKVINTKDLLDPDGVRTKYNKRTGMLEVSIKKA
jgi:hypothetical protein